MDRWNRVRSVGIVLLVATTSAALTYGLTTSTASQAPESLASPAVPRISLDPTDWSLDAISVDPQVATRAIEQLRGMGRGGLETFTNVHIRELAKFSDQAACGCASDSPERRLADAYDRIAGQRDAWTSGLYWYTDFEAAKRAAEREGKPILTLRMLGKLTEELSCANSRFFRTTLYSDLNVAHYLRHNFVLHWHSIRPVPKLTVDYGDGRRLERTITGNSAHYVLDRRGRVVDVLPGLYSPKVFTQELDRAVATARSLDVVEPRFRDRLLVTYHIENRERLSRELSARRAEVERRVTPSDRWGTTSGAGPVLMPKGMAEVAAARVVTPAPLPDLPVQSNGPVQTSGPAIAMPPVAPGRSAQGVFSSDLDIPFNKNSLEEKVSRAITSEALPDIPAKTVGKRGGQVWVPMQTAGTPVAPQADVHIGGPIGANGSDSVVALPSEAPLSRELIERLAGGIEAEVQLHPNAIRLIQAKLDAIPTEYLPAARPVITSTAMANLRRGIAYETARNEYDFRRRVHGWLAAWNDVDLEQIDDRVYAELFLMPRTDPWAGLLSIESFAAIDGAGIVVEKRTDAR